MVSTFGPRSKSTPIIETINKRKKEPEIPMALPEALKYLEDFELESIAYAKSFSYEVEAMRKKLESCRKKMPLVYFLLNTPWPIWAYLYKTTTPLLFWSGFITHTMIVFLIFYEWLDRKQFLNYHVMKLKSASTSFTMLAHDARNLKKIWSDKGPTVSQFEYRINDWSSKKRYALEEVQSSFVPPPEQISEMKIMAQSELL